MLFIEQQTGRRLKAWEQADILAALDLDGQAAAAFLAAFAKTYGVDMAGYEPGYHHRDRGRAARFGWPVQVPLLFGVRVPLPVTTLVLAARSGAWPLRYPVLSPVPVRDWVNWPLVLVALPLLAALLLMAFRAIF